jgi:hypothetical protein
VGEENPLPPSPLTDDELLPYDAPSAGPAPAHPRRKAKGWLIGLAVGLVVALLCCCGGGLFLAYKFAQADPKDAVTHYLEAVRDQDRDKLTKSTCKTFRDRDTLAAIDSADSRDFLRGLTWKLGADREISSDRHEVDVEITFKVFAESPTSIDATFVVVDENGWKVCALKG